MPIPLQLRLDSSRPDAGNWRGCWTSARRILRCDRPDHTTLHDGDRVVQTWRDPLDALRWMAGSLANTADRSTARWIGYLSYDLGRLFENIPSLAHDEESSPLFVFSEVGAKERRRKPPFTSDCFRRPTKLVNRTFSEDEYRAAVARAIDYIRAGDAFQVNLSQLF